MRIRQFFTLCFIFTLYSCNSGSKELKPIQQQQSGDYTVAALSETGTLKQSTGDFVLEFRKTADNQLVDVGTVDVAPVMEMPGMGPMMATAKVTRTDVAGRYNVSGEFSMIGLWRCNVTFGSGQSVRFNLSAQ